MLVSERGAHGAGVDRHNFRKKMSNQAGSQREPEKNQTQAENPSENGYSRALGLSSVEAQISQGRGSQDPLVAKVSPNWNLD